MFDAVRAVHKRIKGSYAVVALIAGHGLLAFRDPFGIRPLCIGEGTGPEGREVMVASESVAIEGTGHKVLRDVAPGEAVFIDLDGVVHARQCADKPSLNPCMGASTFCSPMVRRSMRTRRRTFIGCSAATRSRPRTSSTTT